MAAAAAKKKRFIPTFDICAIGLLIIKNNRMANKMYKPYCPLRPKIVNGKLFKWHIHQDLFASTVAILVRVFSRRKVFYFVIIQSNEPLYLTHFVALLFDALFRSTDT